MLTLFKSEGAPVRRSALEAAAWGAQEAVTANALDVALHRLRRKLDSLGSHCRSPTSVGSAMPWWKAEWRKSLTVQLLATYLVAWLLTLGVLGASFWILLNNMEAEKAQEAAQAISKAIVFDAQGAPRAHRPARTT